MLSTLSASVCGITLSLQTCLICWARITHLFGFHILHVYTVNALQKQTPPPHPPTHTHTLSARLSLNYYVKVLKVSLYHFQCAQKIRWSEIYITYMYNRSRDKNAVKAGSQLVKWVSHLDSLSANVDAAWIPAAIGRYNIQTPPEYTHICMRMSATKRDEHQDEASQYSSVITLGENPGCY